MRLIFLWCCFVAAYCQTQDDGFYAPQTFREHVDGYQQGLFKPSSNDVIPQGSIHEPWRPEPLWKQRGPAAITPAKVVEPWRPLNPGKEQHAAILHHKQALTSEGNFRYEYASDNGLAAGEIIEPDGTRIGAYQYKDPNGQIVKLKYKAGKDGFQIIEGSHVPKSIEPVAPPQQETHYQQAYEQQRRQFDLQQNYNQNKPKNLWTNSQNQGYGGEKSTAPAAGNQYFTQNWQAGGKEDDGQYRENDIDDNINNRGPHTFGEGYAFSFQG